MKSRPTQLALIILAGTLATQAIAHEGHDHGPAPAPTVTTLAPRASAESEWFELVAVLEADGDRLLLYLDHHASNEPVADARIELDSGSRRAIAEALAPGLHALPAGELSRPGTHPLTFTVQAGDDIDLLAASLVVPAPAATAADRAWPDWTPWGAGAALLGLAGLTGWWRARRRAGARS